jgi:hypothetical protein
VGICVLSLAVLLLVRGEVEVYQQEVLPSKLTVHRTPEWLYPDHTFNNLLGHAIKHLRKPFGLRSFCATEGDHLTSALFSLTLCANV